MKKGTVGKIVIFTVVGGVLLLSTKSCIDGYIDEANFKKYYKGNNKPTTSSSEFVTQPTTYDVTEASFSHDYSEYVNEDVYNTLLNARNKYESLLYGDDSVSEKMLYTGIKLNVNDSGHIDSGVKSIYDLICGYISSYDNKDFNACYNYALKLNEYSYKITNTYLYDLLVKNNLDSDFQSNIKYDEYGMPIYQYGNILLENGKQIRFLGGDNSFTNNLNDFNSRMKWIESIPAMLFDRYSQIRNIDNDGVCYVINVTKANGYCTKEINSLISECSSAYNVDENGIKINESDGEYYFTSNGQMLGLLDYNQKSRYELIKYINDAITAGKADCLLLDSQVSNIYNDQSNNTYNK